MQESSAATASVRPFSGIAIGLIPASRFGAGSVPAKNSRVVRRFQNRQLTARPTVRGLNVAASNLAVGNTPVPLTR